MQDRRTFMGRLALILAGLVGATTEECKGSSEKPKGNKTLDHAIEAYTREYGLSPWAILVSEDIFKGLLPGLPDNGNRWLIQPTRQGGRPVIIYQGVVIVLWYWVGLKFSDECRIAMPISHDEACNILQGPGKNIDPLTLYSERKGA